MLASPALIVDATLAGALAAGPSGALFWLAATISQRACRLPPPSARAVQATALALVGIAVWWPEQLLLGNGALAPAKSAAPLVLAMLLAASARTAAIMASRSAPGKFVASVLCTCGLAVLHGAVVAQERFGSPGLHASAASALLMSLVAASLLLLNLEREEPARHRTLRVIGSALCASVVLTCASLDVSADTFGRANAAWSQTAMMVCMALLAGVLVRVLVHASPIPLAESRTQRPSASIDVLTKLPTRVDFEDRLAAQVASADATRSRLALLFIDLDGFKPVNDTFGHSSGDIVLKQVGERLRSASRFNDAATRIGGDEFVLMATGNPTPDAIGEVAKRLIDDISRPYDIGDREVVISCSIGIVLYPDSGSHTKLIARADAAMYEAKRSGGGCYCFYTSAMDENTREKFELVSDLRQAIDNNEMELFYQPKIDGRSGQITAAEALLRWKHPKRGIVPPALFIPLAERFGLISALGNWVIEDACRQARRWRDSGLRMRVAINLSALQMRQEDLVQRIVGALQRNGIQPSLLTCEITESVAMEDTKSTQRTLRSLGKAGIHVSIDDFGTGYSSLSYLRRLPAEELKIDRTFVTDIENSTDARAVVDAVIKLAHALGLRVVAEGVENQRQNELLVQMGCDEMQGFLFAKPMPARSLLLWAMDDRKQAADTTTFRPSLFT
jgi:diguanylate cyclase (GGDEF)-like protein